MTGCALVIAGLWVGIVVGVAAVAAAGAAVWPLITALPTLPRTLPPTEFQVPEWVIERRAEIDKVVAALSKGPAGAVGTTTALQGAGGFGKTILARMVSADRRVRNRFRGGVYWVTLGRDLRSSGALAVKVNDAIRLVAGENAAFADPQLAGQRLGALMNTGPRRLLILDDVWDSRQLAPFIDGGRRCARLVTTSSARSAGRARRRTPGRSDVGGGIAQAADLWPATAG